MLPFLTADYTDSADLFFHHEGHEGKSDTDEHGFTRSFFTTENTKKHEEKLDTDSHGFTLFNLLPQRAQSGTEYCFN
jgi:hypothetical protein